MLQIIVASAVASITLSCMAHAETVTDYKMTADKSGYPCFLELQTDDNKSFALQLSDYKDIWSMTIAVSNRPEVYRNFFTSNQLRDTEKLDQTFTQVKIGSSAAEINEVTMLEVQRKDVDEDTTAFFDIKEKHNVVAALNAMSEDGITISGLFSIKNTVSTTEEFRTCSFDALGVESGKAVEYDIRSELRMIFEKSFETWVSNMARAEVCMQAQFDKDKLDAIISEASDAFYPGIFNIMKRSEYEDDMASKIPLAKLSGLAEAKSNGCLMAGSLADMARITMEQAIDAAEE